MDYDRLLGVGFRPYRILAWAIGWFLLVVAAVTFLGMSGWPWRLTSLQPYLVRYAADNWLYNAFSIYSVDDGDSQNLTKIVYVGGSVCLEGLPSDSRMETELDKRLERPVRFVSICSPYQNFADEARIVDALGSFDGILVLGTEPPFFSKVADRQFEATADAGEADRNGNFYLPIPANLRRIAIREGVEVSLLTDVSQFWKVAPAAIMQAWSRASRDGETRLRRHRITAYREVDYDDLARRVIANYWASADMNESLRRETIRTAVTAGNRVAIFEIPNDEAMLALFDPIRDDYQQRIDRMVRDLSPLYFRPQSKSSWVKQDFFDVHHMSPTGREKFAPILADFLASAILNESAPIIPIPGE